MKTLKAWVHNVKKNPIDDHQLQMAHDIQKLFDLLYYAVDSMEYCQRNNKYGIDVVVEDVTNKIRNELES